MPQRMIYHPMNGISTLFYSVGACHLLSQRMFSLALKLSFCYFLALKSSATDAVEREQRVLAHFAESRGGKATLVVD